MRIGSSSTLPVSYDGNAHSRIAFVVDFVVAPPADLAMFSIRIFISGVTSRRTVFALFVLDMVTF